MREHSRSTMFITIAVSILLGIGIIWLLRDNVSLIVSIPILLGFIAVIIAFFQLVLTPSPSPLGVPSSFDEMIRRRLQAGTGAVIVKVNENLVGHGFHLLVKKEVVAWQHGLGAAQPTIVQPAIVNKYKEKNYIFYAAVFESVPPGDYFLWKGRVGVDMNDPDRSRGVTIFPGRVSKVLFD